MAKPIQPTGHEVRFADEDIIVSKTDLRGTITYANDVFLKVAGYKEAEVLGQPHNMIRHPEMPRCVFKLLWDHLQAQKEIFAYVMNMAKNGDLYWVFAHVTPSYNPQGQHVGYHSNRRVPYADALPKVKALYQQLRLEEQRHPDPRASLQAGTRKLEAVLQSSKMDYSRFVFQLSHNTTLDAAV